MRRGDVEDDEDGDDGVDSGGSRKGGEPLGELPMSCCSYAAAAAARLPGLGVTFKVLSNIWLKNEFAFK